MTLECGSSPGDDATGPGTLKGRDKMEPGNTGRRHESGTYTGTDCSAGIKGLVGRPEYNHNTADAEAALETARALKRMQTGFPLCIPVRTSDGYTNSPSTTHVTLAPGSGRSVSRAGGSPSPTSGS
jgi:hypothetical protein